MPPPIGIRTIGMPAQVPAVPFGQPNPYGATPQGAAGFGAAAPYVAPPPGSFGQPNPYGATPQGAAGFGQGRTSADVMNALLGGSGSMAGGRFGDGTMPSQAQGSPAWMQFLASGAEFPRLMAPPQNEFQNARNQYRQAISVLPARMGSPLNPGFAPGAPGMTPNVPWQTILQKILAPRQAPQTGVPQTPIFNDQSFFERSPG